MLNVMEAVRRAIGVTRIYGIGTRPGAPQYRGHKAYRVTWRRKTIGYVQKETPGHVGPRWWWSLDGSTFSPMPHEHDTKRDAIARVKREAGI